MGIQLNATAVGGRPLEQDPRTFDLPCLRLGIYFSVWSDYPNLVACVLSVNQNLGAYDPALVIIFLRNLTARRKLFNRRSGRYDTCERLQDTGNHVLLFSIMRLPWCLLC
ncbi:hypothetical protein HC256_006245 [Beauveria bassiana]|nr:hypothetical protein HC256_006245 [Beauveria bassiana]